MAIYAIVENGIVVSHQEWDGVSELYLEEGQTAVDTDEEFVDIGYSEDEGVFSSPSDERLTWDIVYLRDTLVGELRKNTTSKIYTGSGGQEYFAHDQRNIIASGVQQDIDDMNTFIGGKITQYQAKKQLLVDAEDQTALLAVDITIT